MGCVRPAYQKTKNYPFWDIYRPANNTKGGTSKDAIKFVKALLGEEDREVFLVLCLNVKNEITAVHRYHVESLNSQHHTSNPPSSITPIATSWHITTHLVTASILLRKLKPTDG